MTFRWSVLLFALCLGVLFMGAVPDARAGDPKPETPEQLAETKRLVKQLDASNKLDSKAAIESLGKLKTPSARKALEKYIKASKNAEWASYAVDALGWAGNKDSVDFLCGKTGLKSKKLLVAEAACRSLARIGEKRAIPSLLEVMKGKKVVLTRASITAVVDLDPKADGIAKHMNKLAKHKSSQVREIVAQAMGKMNKDDVVESLMTMAAKDGNSIVRLESCRSLGRLRAKEAIDTLVKVGDKDKSSDVRREAQVALSLIGVGK